jgi:hypothetical protein
MNKAVLKVLNKLNHPPSGHNFVKLLDITPEGVASKITGMVKRKIRFTYQPSLACIRDLLSLSVAPETLFKAIEKSRPPLGRVHNASLLSAFIEHDKSRGYSTLKYVDSDRFFYRVSQELKVPLSPTAVAIEDGQYLLIFVCGWNAVDFSEMQHRFMWTMLNDAVFSLTDFLNCKAEYCFYPKKTALVGEHIVQELRSPMTVVRGVYSPLSKKEMDELVEIFLKGRDLAKSQLLAWATSEIQNPELEIDRDDDSQTEFKL